MHIAAKDIEVGAHITIASLAGTLEKYNIPRADIIHDFPTPTPYSAVVTDVYHEDDTAVEITFAESDEIYRVDPSDTFNTFPSAVTYRELQQMLDSFADTELDEHVTPDALLALLERLSIGRG